MSDVQKKWEDSSWGRKLLVKKRRASLNDFDRFKLMLAKIKVSDDMWSVCTFSCSPHPLSLASTSIRALNPLFLSCSWFMATYFSNGYYLYFCRELDWWDKSLQSWKRVNLRKHISLSSNFVRDQFKCCGLFSLLLLKHLRIWVASEVHGVLDIQV